MMFLWVIKVCTIVGGYQCFRGMCCIHHPCVLSQPRRPLSKSSLPHAREIFVNFYFKTSISQVLSHHTPLDQ